MDRRARKAIRGYSLLELLVVILLIGLLSTVAVLTLPSDNSQRELRQITERLAAYFRYARQEAVFSGTTHGILWRDNRPLLVKRSAEGWDIKSDSRVESVQAAAAGFEMYLQRQQELLDLSRSFESPQILFTNDGQVSPFELIIRGQDGSEQVLTDSLTLEERN